MPSISTIITTYNRAGLLAQAIQSVLAQTYPDFELIVVDDGSTDNTRNVVESIADARIRYIWQENQERAVARNTGLASSRGQYITFLDSDDRFLPDKLQAQVSMLELHPDIGMVMGGWEDVDAEGAHIRTVRGWDGQTSMGAQNWLFDCPTVIGANLIRREWLIRVGGFNPEQVPGEDTDLWIRLHLAGCPMMWDHQLVMQRRIHAGNTISDLERMRKGHIALIDRLFQAPRFAQSVGLTRNQAHALVLLHAACREYGAFSVETGRRVLSEAIAADPSLLDERGAKILRAVLVWAGNQAPWEDPVAYVRRVLDNLPGSACTLRRRSREARAEAAVVKAFSAYEKKDMAGVRAAVQWAVARKPSLLLNRGAVFIYLESVVGQRRADETRRLVRRLEGGKRKLRSSKLSNG
jgi:glycosyltransferase involved in cell wall biosynthesis